MIKHKIEPIGQIKTMGCWAAAFAMMYSWKSNSTQSIQSTSNKLGQYYYDAYDSNKGLSVKGFDDAIKILGLIHEPPFNPTVEKWLSLISRSPMIVIVD